jgi:hypothetical protein
MTMPPFSLSSAPCHPAAGLFRWLAVAAAWALLGAAILLLMFNFLQDGGSFNSDDLYPSAISEDILHGRDLRGWHLPGAPYPIPDIALLLVCRSLSADPVVVLTIYSCLYYALLGAALAWLARLVGLSRGLALGAGAVGVLFLLAAHLHPDYRGRAMLLSHPGNHMGTILLGLTLLGLVLRGWRSGFGLLTSAAVVVIGSLGGMSDKLLLPQFIGPILGTSCLLWLGGLLPRRKLLITLGLLAGSAALVFPMTRLFILYGFIMLQEEGHLKLFAPFSPEEFADHLMSFVSGQDVCLVLIPLHLSAMLALAVLWLRRRPAEAGAETRAPELDRRAVLFLALSLLLAPLSNLTVIIITGQTLNPGMERYVYACSLLPFLFAGLWPSLLPWPGARFLGGLARAGLVAFAVWRMAPVAADFRAERFAPRYPPVAEALDRLVRQHGPLRGLGEFWSARSLSYLTHEHVPIRATGNTGQPYLHAGNPDGYLSADPHDLTIPDYQLVVIQDVHSNPMPKPDLVVCEYGEPIEKIPAGDHEIWRYDRLIGRDLELFLRAQLASRLRCQRPHVGPSQPACLAKPKANLTLPEARGTVPVEPGDPLDVRFVQPISGKTIDFSATAGNHYLLHFYRGETLLGRVRVPAVTWAGACYTPPGLQSRLVPLPPGLQKETWDRILVEAFASFVDFRVGHLLVFQEEVPYRSAWPEGGSGERRFEGELLGRSMGMKDADGGDCLLDDRAASGGKSFRFPGETPQLFICIPELRLAAGRYRADFVMRAEEGSPGEHPLTLEARADVGRIHLGQCDVTAVELTHGTGYGHHGFDFELAEETDMVQLHLLREGPGATLVLDYIGLTYLGPASATTTEAAASSGGPCP